MTETDTEYDDIEVVVLSDDDVREAIKNALASAGCTWEELQAQAAEGRFASHHAREAWFVVATLDPTTA
ncbi:hypothetical protein [Candidatus Poriferisodalis sp.]|uniref:hypothetical protein n=1 Tax=Candidatus Poriferisodalis sp. TaxID=3101277 RepID=UPI003B0214C8